MEEFLGYTQVTWQALGVMITALTFGAGAIAALSAARQVRLNRRNRELETRPYVIVDLTSSPADENLKDFVVKNIGATPAYKVRISFDQVPRRVREISGYSLPETPMFKSGIAMLAPDRRVSVFFDSVSDRLGQKELPSKYEVTLTYEGLPRKKWWRSDPKF